MSPPPTLLASLADRLSDAPIPYDPDRAEEAAARLADLPPKALALVRGAAGNAPFLNDLLRIETDFARACFATAPEACLDALIDSLERPDIPIAQRLRQAKRRAALLIALADLGGVWDLTQVTGAISAFADAAIATALDHLTHQAIAARHIESADGLFVLGLGKLGARELNYSSDVDLVVFFDADRFRALGSKSATERGIAIVQGLMRLIHDVTADGYVFRVDLRLRPDPGAMPVALSTNAAEIYYESRGQVWERAAFIKARVVAGDEAAGQAFLERLHPFVFRKYLDFASIEEIHDIKRRLNAHAGHGAIAIEGHDIKIGRGGIREIEFFAQGQQLIAGGREPKLRTNRTLAALAALTDRGMIRDRTFRELADAYRHLRTLEHRLQMVADEQTQRLPRDPAGIDRIARFMGYADTTRFREVLTGHLTRVAAHYDALFAESGPSPEQIDFDGPEVPAATLERLREMGFADPDQVGRLVRGWLAGRPPCLAQERARARLRALLLPLLTAFGASDDPMGALVRFDAFVHRLTTGAQIFALLQNNPRLVDLLVTVMGSAPRLAHLLAAEADTIDAVVAPGFFEELPSPRALGRIFERLGGALDEVLAGTARIAREGRLRVGLQLLTGRIGADSAGPFLADLAVAATRRILQAVESDLAARHGIVPGAEFAVLGFGRLGGREMTVTSDLDLVFVYRLGAGAEVSDGPEPLDATTYFLRLGQRLIAALTTPTVEGPMFAVDMRLRPTGNKGPIAVTIEALRRYYAEDAWTYEKMALTRARVIAGAPALGADLSALIAAILDAPGDQGALARDIRDMRERVARERPATSHWQFKEARGGLMDIEFAAQRLALRLVRPPGARPTDTRGMLAAAARAGLVDADAMAGLDAALVLQLDLQQMIRVALDGHFDPASVPPGLAAILSRTGRAPDMAALAADLARHQASAASLVAHVLAE